MTTTVDYADIPSLKGRDLGVSEYRVVTQDQIDLFADATDDHQWIHVDPEKAKAGPFGTTIAHGFLTLSLLPELVGRVFHVEGTRMGVNYGSDRLRFTSPVPVGSRVRARVELLDVTDIAGGVRLTTRVTVEIEGAERPALVVDWLTLRYV